jgi:hypothetical protein
VIPTHCLSCGGSLKHYPAIQRKPGERSLPRFVVADSHRQNCHIKEMWRCPACGGTVDEQDWKLAMLSK